MAKTIAIGGCSGWWGDPSVDAAIEMMEKTDVKYLMFDFLAELTMTLLYRMKVRNPDKGYCADLVTTWKKLIPAAKANGVKLITNGGGANPLAAGQAVINVAKEMGIKGLKVGVVTGDDLTDRIDDLRAKGISLANMETGEDGFARIQDKLVGAYAYIGADRVIDALKEDADIIIGGRLADNALAVGPWMHEFGWEYKEPYWDKIGAAITCGHIIECSICVTGGVMCSWWNEVPEPWNVGYPIAELDENGESIITKTPGTGGMLTKETVKEHLVYEVHDPNNYIMPDGIPSFTTPHLEEVGENRVKVTNMSGKERPEQIKVGIGFMDGWKIETQQWFVWPDALKKAKRSELILNEWIKRSQIKPVEMNISYMGYNMINPLIPVPESAPDLPEVGLRICAKFKTRKEAIIFRREGPRWLSFASGWVFNTTTAPAAPSEIVALWPTLVPREEIKTDLTMLEVK